MPWYSGPSLMEHLETVPMARGLAAEPFRLPVQWVNRPNQDFRGFAGAIASGVDAAWAIRWWCCLPAASAASTRDRQRLHARSTAPSPASRSR